MTSVLVRFSGDFSIFCNSATIHELGTNQTRDGADFENLTIHCTHDALFTNWLQSWAGFLFRKITKQMGSGRESDAVCKTDREDYKRNLDHDQKRISDGTAP
jgi:hypothetical protein